MKKKCAKRLKELRESKNLTQEALSAIVGVPAPTLSRYEAGKNFPKTEALYRYCHYFKVSADYILGLSDYRQSIDYYQKDSEVMMAKLKAFNEIRYSIEKYEEEVEDLKRKVKLRDYEGV